MAIKNSAFSPAVSAPTEDLASPAQMQIVKGIKTFFPPRPQLLQLTEISHLQIQLEERQKKHKYYYVRCTNCSPGWESIHLSPWAGNSCSHHSRVAIRGYGNRWLEVPEKSVRFTLNAWGISQKKVNPWFLKESVAGSAESFQRPVLPNVGSLQTLALSRLSTQVAPG